MPFEYTPQQKRALEVVREVMLRTKQNAASELAMCHAFRKGTQPLHIIHGEPTEVHGQGNQVWKFATRRFKQDMALVAYLRAKEEYAAHAARVLPALVKALKDVVACPDYKGINTHEMNAARSALAYADRVKQP